MQKDDQVVQLNQELAGTKVLSVYLNAEEHDPAERRAWRIRLNTMLKELQEEADEPGGDRRAIAGAISLIEAELRQHDGILPGRGWVGFATEDRLWYGGHSPVPMPNLVRWENGAHVAPYVRALKQTRPVTALIADRRHVRIFRYQHGDLVEEDPVWSDSAIADSTSAGSAKRASTHSGMRGEPRGDAIRRSEDASVQRMLKEVADVAATAGREGHLIVVGGHVETASALSKTLSDQVRERAIDVSGLHVEASSAEVKQAIEEAASVLTLRLQKSLVEEVLDTTRADGRACLGVERTERALQIGAVDTLIVSRRFARAEPEVAERLIDQAFDQGAQVEEIAEAASEELDREGGGIGARLRFAA